MFIPHSFKALRRRVQTPFTLLKKLARKIKKDSKKSSRRKTPHEKRDFEKAPKLETPAFDVSQPWVISALPLSSSEISSNSASISLPTRRFDALPTREILSSQKEGRRQTSSERESVPSQAHVDRVRSIEARSSNGVQLPTPFHLPIGDSPSKAQELTSTSPTVQPAIAAEVLKETATEKPPVYESSDNFSEIVFITPSAAIAQFLEGSVTSEERSDTTGDDRSLPEVQQPVVPDPAVEGCFKDGEAIHKDDIRCSVDTAPHAPTPVPEEDYSQATELTSQQTTEASSTKVDFSDGDKAAEGQQSCATDVAPVEDCSKDTENTGQRVESCDDPSILADPVPSVVDSPVPKPRPASREFVLLTSRIPRLSCSPPSGSVALREARTSPTGPSKPPSSPNKDEAIMAELQASVRSREKRRIEKERELRELRQVVTSQMVDAQEFGIRKTEQAVDPDGVRAEIRSWRKQRESVIKGSPGDLVKAAAYREAMLREDIMVDLMSTVRKRTRQSCGREDPGEDRFAPLAHVPG